MIFASVSHPTLTLTRHLLIPGCKVKEKAAGHVCAINRVSADDARRPISIILESRRNVLFSPSSLMGNATCSHSGGMWSREGCLCYPLRNYMVVVTAWSRGPRVCSEGEKMGPQVQHHLSPDGKEHRGSHIWGGASARCLKEDAISNLPSCLMQGWEYGS